MKRVELHQFRSWCQTLDDAVEHLPVDPDWPHELHILLAENVPQKKRRLVMWTEGDVPIGVAAFVQEPRGTWEPVTHWILPGTVGLVAAPRIGSLFGLLPFRTRIAWWRMIEPLPSGDEIRWAAEEPTYGIPCSDDFEAYWKQTDQLRAIKKARDRCKHLTLTVNAPGASEWVLQQSEKHWRPRGQAVSVHLANQMVATKYLETRGKSVTVALQDGEEFVGADLFIVHRNEAVFSTTFRNREYDQYGVGNRSMEEVFYWARNSGMGRLDLGGGFSYKSRWAPMLGAKATLLIASKSQYAGYRAREKTSYLMRRGEQILSKVRKIGIKQSCEIAVTRIIDRMRRDL
jgi:hypothetical protein